MHASTTLTDAADLLSLSGRSALPVLDEAGDYADVVAQAVAKALAEQPEGAPAVVGQLAEPPAPVTADQPLSQALHSLLGSVNRRTRAGVGTRQPGRVTQPPERAARGTHCHLTTF
ncbi:hypothetical protein [Streptomyces sp900116325]|uniref:hypothetical protein n=1 Tax=Streptomyces sp. 900116325 TaxID=3154295 RepID=UPI003408C114